MSLAAGPGAARAGRIHAVAAMQTNPLDELGAAIEAERAAWRAVRDHLPGTPGHDPQLWEAWRAAMRRCEDARKILAQQRQRTAAVKRHE